MPEVIDQPSVEMASDAATVYEFWGWAHQANEQFDKSFIVISRSRKYPVPPKYKGFHLIWRIGAVLTSDPISVKLEYEPSVGDVCCTMDDEIIRLVSVDYA